MQTEQAFSHCVRRLSAKVLGLVGPPLNMTTSTESQSRRGRRPVHAPERPLVCCCPLVRRPRRTRRRRDLSRYMGVRGARGAWSRALPCPFRYCSSPSHAGASTCNSSARATRPPRHLAQPQRGGRGGGAVVEREVARLCRRSNRSRKRTRRSKTVQDDC